MKNGEMDASPPATAQSFLAFDIGRKRTGVAYASLLLGQAQPQGTIQAEGQARWPLIQKHVQTWQPDALVIGIPYHPDGAEHENTRFARSVARQMRVKYQLPVIEIDERYSTTEALAHAKSAHQIDALSACVILDQYLRSLK
jgi:putative Holliday junction resolvase